MSVKTWGDVAQHMRQIRDTTVRDLDCYRNAGNRQAANFSEVEAEYKDRLAAIDVVLDFIKCLDGKQRV